MSSANPAIKKLVAKKLCVKRNHRAIVHDVDFMLAPGQVLTITGDNGSGKSTLLRALCGLLSLSGGRVELQFSKDQKLEDGSSRAQLPAFAHYLGHENALKPALTLRENLSFWQDFCGASDAPKGLSIEQALARLNLTAAIELAYGGLSAGQKRRAALARLLLNHKPVWLVDEPTAALDEKSVKLFAKLVKAHCAGGGMVIAATHLPLGLKPTKIIKLPTLEGRQGYALSDEEYF